MDDIIKVKSMTKSFGDVVKTEVLHGIDISFSKGAFTAIIGPSGSGKTSLLNIISLLEFPTAGYLEVLGIDFSEGLINKYAKFRNENIGFIFQFHYLLPEFNALENILIPHWISLGKPTESVINKALSLMKKIGIDNIKSKYPNQISGGQQQRIAIVRALMNNPKIIFADEPTGNLDRESGDAVLDVLKTMIRETGTSLIMVTHDREIALNADRIVELVDGRICKSFLINEIGKDKAKKLLEERTCNVL
jgi:lipoprotein-releasing system ATP-binding protein